ncbi:GLPGLI family protein [Flavobacterium dankookense]|uniref:GLPGLI family protein n=1 Tax=Flavobacterium dankookense TaxID=706186 RepID=A0A4R6QA54_9FLAO|nr:GLPGLI family protein [Flavobacterium dankookense]TDP58613.1 GLPGLI family protein [Flavobacterium dankookense]
MTKVVLISSFLLMGFLAKAQEFQGKAEYFSKRIMKKNAEKIVAQKDEPLDPELQKAVEEAMKRASEKQFVLTFNKTECLYEEQQKLDKPEANDGMSISISFSSAGKKYLNVKDKNSIVEDNIFGKEFLVVEPIVQPEWKLIDETKKIGDYNCFKAELLIPVSEKQKKDYEEFLKKEEKKPALFKMEKPEDKVVTAWYSPEIPVSFGPDNYWGLPGLILEVNDGENMLLCSKVVLSNKEKAKIKAPNNGEKTTQKKFDEILKKKTASMANEDGVIIFEH